MAAPRLSFPRLHRRASDGAAPLPLSPVAVAVRENLAEHRHQLAELDPRALDLGAQMLAGIHEVLNGRMTELRGCGSPEYRRRQLLGRDGLPIEDVAYLALHAPEAVVPLLRILGAAVGHTVAPDEPDQAAGVAAELAGVEQAFGQSIAAITERLEDGLTPEEAAECDGRLHDLERHVRALEAALHERAMGGGR